MANRNLELLVLGLLLVLEVALISTQSPIPQRNLVKKETLYKPQTPSLEQVFQNDHNWVDALPQEHIRTLVATGDVMLGRVVNSKMVQSKDFTWPFKKTIGLLKNADISFVNLEGPLTENCPVTTEGMKFCGDIRNTQGLVYSGVDVANLANNHTSNYEDEGLDTTINVLKKSNIAVTGLSGATYKDIERLRFAFLGYNAISPQAQGTSWAKEDKIISEIKEAKNNSTIVVVAFHWGVEYTTQPTNKQRELAHLAIDSGADVVIGNHPHWIQPVEIYKNKVITYSHGNFVFDQMWSQKTREGVVGKYTFYDNQLIDVEFLPVIIEDFGQPRFATELDKQRILSGMKEASYQLYQ